MRKSLVACAVLAIVALAGCVDYPFGAPWRDVSHHNSSSLVEFLYPGGRTPPHDNSVPELHLPLRVGLAFLPPHDGSSVGPDAALRQELLERVRQHFKDRKFVSEIVLVPDYYLTTRRGFEGLEAMQRLYAVDLMALVSYDQVTHGDTNEWSLGYLTIVGMYVLKGNRYDVSTAGGPGGGRSGQPITRAARRRYGRARAAGPLWLRPPASYARRAATGSAPRPTR